MLRQLSEFRRLLEPGGSALIAKNVAIRNRPYSRFAAKDIGNRFFVSERRRSRTQWL